MPLYPPPSSGGSGGVTDHGALTGLADDDHTAYALDADLTTHAGAADPHAGYQLEAEKGAANGYAPLGSGLLVPIANLPTGTGATQVALGNHTHAGGGGGATYVKKAADQAVTSATFVSDMELTFNPAANTDYHIRLYVIWQSVLTSVGARFALLLPTTGTTLAWFKGSQQVTVTGTASPDMFTEDMIATSDSDIVTALAAANQLANQLVLFEGVLSTGASVVGPFALRVQSELAANAITVKAKSFLRYQSY